MEVIQVTTDAAKGVANRNALLPRTIWKPLRQASNIEASDPVASGLEESLLLGRTMLIADEAGQVRNAG